MVLLLCAVILHRAETLNCQMSSIEGRKTCYAAERNKEPILGVLKTLAPAPRRFFEVSSGTGEHAETFLSQIDQMEFYQPSELDVEMFSSILAWTSEFQGAKCKSPIKLDVTNAKDVASLDEAAYDCLININLIHISPAGATAGLFEVAHRVLDANGVVLTYGPYRVDGFMVESNVNFDLSLKSRNPDWGVRDLEWVGAEAAKSGFVLDRTVSMPANNLACIWKRSQTQTQTQT